MFRKGHILTESFVAVIDTMSIAVDVFFCHPSDNSYVVYVYTDHIYHKVIVSSSHHNNTKHMFRKGLNKIKKLAENVSFCKFVVLTPKI